MVVIPANAGIQYAAAYRLNRGVSGILDHPPQCAIAHKAGDDAGVTQASWSIRVP